MTWICPKCHGPVIECRTHWACEKDKIVLWTSDLVEVMEKKPED